MENFHGKDTDEASGQDSSDGSPWNGILSIFQITRSVAPCHDTCRMNKEDNCIPLTLLPREISVCTQNLI